MELSDKLKKTVDLAVAPNCNKEFNLVSTSFFECQRIRARRYFKAKMEQFSEMQNKKKKHCGET